MIKFKQLFGLIIGLICTNSFSDAQHHQYYGKLIAQLSELHHGVSGEVYAVDARTLFLKNFNYDGEGPAAYFYVGNGRRPTNDGAIRLRDETGSSGVIKRYRNKDITLTLPEGKTLRDFNWFSVWCDEFSVNFGDVTIPKTFDYPRPQKVGALNGVHGISSDNIVIVDAQTLLIPNFSYDGGAPDAKFWVGRGSRPTPRGLRIPNENGKETPLTKYTKQTIVLSLPKDLTIFDIGHFGVWCEAFTVDFAHILIPENINVPPSLKMLGISPQSKLNCEVLHDNLAYEVRWAVAGKSIVVQLVAKLETGQYMSFGISPNKQHTEMIGADVVVAWVDQETTNGYAIDYYLDDKSQCSGKRGSCPDTRLLDNSNSVQLINAATVNGYSIITYQRPLKAMDHFDLPIMANQSQAIVWAIGPLNQRSEVSYHSHRTNGDRFIHFGRRAHWNCPSSNDDIKMNMNTNAYGGHDVEDDEYISNRNSAVVNRPQNSQQSVRPIDTNRRGTTPQRGSIQNRRKVPTPRPVPKNGAWDIPPIQCFEPDDGVFYAQMGPTGGKHGYPAITGHVGWGISWYINGLLIPEINVVRGRTYTFVTEGGNDPDIPAKYHPFYITDDSVGGYEHKTEEEKSKVRIFAGVQRTRTGAVIPTGIGRLCNWTPDIDGPPADEYISFGAYQRTLTLVCDHGEPGIVTWTPDTNTPDTVYYQCFTHRYLGWKINVLDECDDDVAAVQDTEIQASEIDEVYTSLDREDDEDSVDSLEKESSIRYETKIRPNEIFLQQQDKDLVKNHNMNIEDASIRKTLTTNKDSPNKKSEISQLITEGIRAAEALEESIKKSKLNSTLETHSSNIIPDYDTLLDDFPLKNIKNHRYTVPSIEYNSQNNYIQQTVNTNDKNKQISVFLTPPNAPNGQLLKRPVKLPNRGILSPPTAILLEKRPVNNIYRPFVLPQPSMIVSHYKKPINRIIRPSFVQHSKPIKPSYFLLGQPTEVPASSVVRRPSMEYKPVIYSTEKHLHSDVRIIPQNKKSDFVQQNSYVKSRDDIQKYDHLQIVENNDKIILNKEDNPMTYRMPVPLKKPIQTPVQIMVTESSPAEDELITFKPAVNTGFQPDSIIIEGGFKPIVRRRIDNTNSHQTIGRRHDIDTVDNSDIDKAIESDVILIGRQIQNKSFSPMFVPSPLDSLTILKNQQQQQQQQQQNEEETEDNGNEHLSGDLRDMNVEDGEDKMAMAAERTDAYYLPPDNRPLSVIQGNRFPEGSVVTYDGKAVSDTSFVNTASPIEAQSTINHIRYSGLSKTEQFIRNTPQFGPFKGDIPPPIPDFIPPDSMPQISTNKQKPHRPVTEYTNPLTTSTNPISTKLTLVRN